MEKNEINPGNPQTLRSLVIVFSYHHNNTEKIANACAKVLGAEVKTPQQVKPEEIAEYDLIGFGSGIYSATFDPSLLDLADRLPTGCGKQKVFLFSTYGAPAFIANRDFIEEEPPADAGKAAGERVHGHRGIRVCGVEHEQFLKIFRGTEQGQTKY